MKDDKEETKIPLIGISLRNWYAGMALPIILKVMYQAPNEDVARQCFQMADSMIEESKK
jgi:hypothetical protein